MRAFALFVLLLAICGSAFWWAARDRDRSSEITVYNHGPSHVIRTAPKTVKPSKPVGQPKAVAPNTYKPSTPSVYGPQMTEVPGNPGPHGIHYWQYGRD